MVAGFGQHDPDVRQRRLDEDRGDVLVGERPLERGDVVERDDARRERRIDRRADVQVRRDDAAVGVEGGEGLVDRAVVALVVDDDLRPAGDPAGRGGSRTGSRRSRSG